jgi:hypothetical protein
MLISRDYVTYMAQEVVKRLLADQMLETKTTTEELVTRVRQAMAEELAVEERVNEEARQILNDHSDEMRRTGVSYQEMFKKVKAQIAKDRKLILR